MDKRVLSICFLTAIAVLIVYIGFVTVPQFSGLTELNRQLENRRRITAVRERNLSNIESNKASIEELKAECAALENIIVPESELVMAILSVSDLFERYELEEQSFRMTDYVSVDNLLSRDYNLRYMQASAEFSVIGESDNIYQFLRGWKKSDIMYMIDGLTVSGEGITNGRVKLTVKFSVFFSE